MLLPFQNRSKLYYCQRLYHLQGRNHLGTAGSIPAETSGDAHIHLECMKDGAYLDPEGLM